MIFIYFIILLYLAPKVATVYQQRDGELFFNSRREAYEAALRDMRAEEARKKAEEAQRIADKKAADEAGFKDADILKIDDDMFA